MKNGRWITLLLTLALLLPCLAAVPASAADTGVQLYHKTAPASVDEGKALWPGNSGTAWQRTCAIDGGETVSEFEYYLNNSGTASTPGVPVGDTLYYDVPDLRIATKPYAEIEFVLQYAWVKANGDNDVGATERFMIYASTDGGQTWSSETASLREQTMIGTGKTSNGHDAVIYRVTSTDLKALVPEGATINRLRVRPFGLTGSLLGAHRIQSITVNGYTEKRPDADAPLTRTGAGTIPVSEEVMRRLVVDRVYEVANKQWTTDTELITFNGAKDEAHTQYYRAGFLYKGPAYTRSVRSTWEMFSDAIDLNGRYTGSTEIDQAVGMSCTPLATSGLTLISNARYYATEYVMQAEGVELVGGLTNETGSGNSGDVWSKYDAAELYEAYAQMKHGDFVLVQNGVQQHDRVNTKDPKIVRFEGSDRINPFESKAFLTETKGTVEYYWQDKDGSVIASTNKDPAGYQAQHPDYTYLYGSSIRIDKEYTFAELYETGYLPYTVEEYRKGAVNAPAVRIDTGAAADNLVSAGFTATVASNWQLNAITASVTDRNTGRRVFEDVTYTDLYTFQTRYQNEKLDAALKALPAGAYTFALDVTAGPVTAVGGSRPVTRAAELTFAVGGAAIPASIPTLDTAGADGWAVDWLNKAFTRGLLSGINRTGFTRDVTRLQFADLAVSLAEVLTGKDIAPAAADSFTDTAQAAILKAKTAGISAGYAVDGKFEFRPDNPITRQEICVMLDHVMEYVAANGGKLFQGTGEIAERFVDRAEVADWARAQVARMTLSGVMGGKATDKGDAITPQANTTLQEAVTLAIKLDNLLK